jgi:hypothetical protein
LAHEGDEVVSLKHRPPARPYHPGNILGTHLCYEAESILEPLKLLRSQYYWFVKTVDLELETNNIFVIL